MAAWNPSSRGPQHRLGEPPAGAIHAAGRAHGAAGGWLYSEWSSRRTLLLTILITAAGLGLLLLRGTTSLHWLTSPVVPVTLLIVGTNGIISVLLPYAAESYSLRIRGRATGAVAGFSKAGGLVAQLMGIFALVPALDIAAGCVAVPCLLSMVLLASLGPETHGQDLRELEVSTQRG